MQPGNVADLITALKQTGADVAQSELGLTRARRARGGHRHRHRLRPSRSRRLLRAGLPRAKGFDLVGDAFNADDAGADHHARSVPGRLRGHGTHVAGIIGANGGIKGVAPGVTFHAYRVFGCEGPTTSDIMLDAMERRVDDGADVVNMSIGAAFQWPQYPTAQAANRLVRRGVVVVASTGNEGALGLYAASAPGVGKDVIGVASFDNTHANLRRVHDLARRHADRLHQRDGRRRHADLRHVPDGADRHARRLPTTRAAPLAGREPDRQGRAHSPRHLRLLSEGVQRTDRRRRRRRAVQQRRRPRLADRRR